MKIVYTAFVRLPTEKAHGVQIMKTCEAFVKQGAEVELLVPTRKTHIKENPFVYYDVQENFKITRIPTPDLVPLGFLGFMFAALWFAERVKWRRVFRDADVVYSRDAFVLLQYLLLGKRLVYEAHTKPTFVSKIVAKACYRVVLISEGLRDAYLQSGVKEETMVVAHDAIDPKPFTKKYSQTEERTRLGIPLTKKIALYVGRIDAAKGADVFAAASNYLPNDWRCVLVGPGTFKEKLRTQYPKALFLSETPYKELPQVLTTADVVVLPNSATDENAARFTSPLKAFAYLASGKPIVASEVPSLTQILPRSTAVFFEPGDASALAASIVRASQMTRDIRSEKTIHSWDERALSILAVL